MRCDVAESSMRPTFAGRLWMQCYGSIVDAVQAQDPEGAVDAASFSSSMQEFVAASYISALVARVGSKLLPN